MNIEQIKYRAAEMAQVFVDSNILPEFEKENYDTKEWCLLVTLAQIYCNLIKGTYTRDQAKEKQNKAIKYVQEWEG
jgi:hypothetical protein